MVVELPEHLPAVSIAGPVRPEKIATKLQQIMELL
jgi:hypothetical protein